ncbi:MAG: hypothetical protein JXQ96_18975 [Cyclobacteriaceae bacterium]
MKKLSVLIVAVLLSVGAYAQEQGAFRAQVGGSYALDFETLGIDLGVQYFVSDQIAVAPSFTYFLEKNGVSASSINLEGRFYFAEGFYGVTGLDFISQKVDFLGADLTVSDTKLALGAGYDISMGESMVLNLQAKYAGQMVIGAGIVFGF